MMFDGPSKTHFPLVSIGIVTKNGLPYLKDTIKSVVEERNNYPNLEIIVIDGDSQDGTRDFLSTLDNEIEWISEPDTGVSDAVNKFLERANGEYVRLLGDDDEILEGSTKEALDYLSRNPHIDLLICHGNFVSIDSNGVKHEKPVKQPIGHLSFRDLLKVGGRSDEIGWPIPETTFFKRNVFTKYGGYSENYHYSAYLELFLRYASCGATIFALPLKVTFLKATANSDSIKAKQACRLEMEKMLTSTGGWYYKFHKYKQKGGLLGSIRRYTDSVCCRLNFHPLRHFRNI